MINDIDELNVVIEDTDSVTVNEGTPTDIAEIMHNEEIRQENEAQRIENEEAREEYINDLKQRVLDGEFDGEDGFSPIANVVKTDNTSVITITDKVGTTTASVLDGTNGRDGTDGEDGISPTVTMTKQGKVTTLTITDKDGEHTTEIKDGNDGSGTGDMLKATYDTNDNGVVDNAEKVNNHTVQSDVPANAVFTDTTYTAGTGINITNNVISSTSTGSGKQEQLTSLINEQNPFILDDYDSGTYFFKTPSSASESNSLAFKATSTSPLHKNTDDGLKCGFGSNFISVHKKFSDASVGEIVASFKVGKWAQVLDESAYVIDGIKSTPTLLLVKSSSSDVSLVLSERYYNGTAEVLNGKENVFFKPQKYNNVVTYPGNFEFTNDSLIYKKYVDDLAGTKQAIIDSSHKLSADLVDDTNSNNKFLTSGSQTIGGNKTFQSGVTLDSTVVINGGTTINNLTTINGELECESNFYAEGNEATFSCPTSFNDTVTCGTPTEDSEVANKKYVDDNIPDALADLSDDSTHRVVTDTEKTTWNGKQAALVSGTNIKTINSTSLLGSGNIEVGADIPQQDTAPSNPSEDDLWIDTDDNTNLVEIDSQVSTTSTNPIENQAITNYVKGRMDKILVDLTNYVNSSTVSTVGVCKLEIKDNRVLFTSNLKVVPPYNTDTAYNQLTIPEGYRPSAQVNVFAYSDSYKTWGRFYINTDGTVYYKPLVNSIPSGTNDWVKAQCMWDLD